MVGARPRPVARRPRRMWLCRPFRGRPSVEQWHDLIEQVGRMHDSSRWTCWPSTRWPAWRRCGRRTTRRDAGGGGPVAAADVPGRGRAAVSPPAQGGGAGRAGGARQRRAAGLRGHPRGDARGRPADGEGPAARLLRAYSRYAETPPTWAMEWTADGTDYRVLGTSGEPDFERAGRCCGSCWRRRRGR